jgi:hypothetical protein
MRHKALALIMAVQAAPLDRALVVERGRAGSVAIGATADSIYEESRVRQDLLRPTMTRVIGTFWTLLGAFLTFKV